MTRVRRSLRYAGRLVLNVIGTVLLVFVVIYGLLKSGLLTSNLDRIVTLLAKKQGVFFVIAEGIEGGLPEHLRAKKVEVGDATGVYLAIYDAEATWHPFDLFHAFDWVKWRIHVDDIKAKRVVWTRLPHDDKPDDEPFRWDHFVRIVVGHLLVEDLELGGTLLGGATSHLRAEGSGVLGEWQQGFVKLDVAHVDGVSGAARIDLRTHGSPLELEGTIQAEEGPGGALASLARLKDAGAVTLDVRASGPMRDWHGEADVIAANIGKLSAAVNLAYTAEGPFEVTGTFDPVPAQRRKWLVGEGGPMSVYAKGAWAPDVALDIDPARLVADGRELTARGHLDLATHEFRVGGQLVHQKEGETVATTLVDVLGATIEGSGTLGDGGKLEATLDLDRPAVGKVHGSTLHARLTASDPAGESSQHYDLVADAGGLKLDDVTLPLFGAAARLTAKGVVDLEGGLLSTDNAVLEGGDARVAGPVAFSEDWKTMKTSLAGDAKTLESLARVFETTVRGSATATAEIEAKDTWDRFTLKLRANAAGVAIGEPGWNALLGETAALEASVEGAPAGPARGEFSLKTAGIEATGKGEVGADGKGLVADAAVVMDNLARLAEPTRAAIAGHLEAKATARGSLDNFDVAGSVRGDRVSWEGVRFDTLVADVDAKGLPASWQGKLHSTGTYAKQAAALDASVAMPSPGRLVVRDLVLRGPRTEGTASLDVDLTNRIAAGDVHLSSADLSLWRPMTGIPIGGSVELNATLARGMAGGAPSQQVSGALRVAHGQLPLDGGDVFADVLDVVAANLEAGLHPRGAADIHATRVRYNDRTLVEGALTAKGDGRQWDVVTKLDLRDDERQWKIDAGGGLLPVTESSWRLSLARAVGELDGTAIALESPADFAFETSGADAPWSAGPLALRVGKEGRLRGRASFAKGRAMVDAEAHAMPLDVVSLFAPSLDLQGIAEGTLKLEGPTLATASGDLSLRGKDVASQGLEKEGVAAPVDVAVDAHLGAGRVQGTARLEGLRETRLALTIDAPMETTSRTSPFVAGLVWKGNVAEVLALFPFTEDAVGGQVDADLKVTGTMAAPRVTGRAAITDGKWDHEISGLQLRDIDAQLEGSGTSLEIRSLTATDGESGKINGSGRLRFGELPAFDLQVDVDATDAMLARVDILTAKADAKLQLHASRTAEDNADIDGAITGSVQVKDGRIEIPQRFISDVPEIDVVEVGTEVADAIETAHVTKTLLDLDIAIEADNRIYVSGRGLESEWSSNVHVRGTTHEPRIEGKITSVRGQLSLLGRQFDIDSATLLFDGERDNIPYLTLTARAEANDITAIADVTGPATHPTIELRSEPSLPRDEVLSRILFGQSAANLTPIQSVQLARGVAELTGSPLGGGGGFMTGIGRTLGFDRLDIASGSDGAAALTASKYLTDNVYLRVQGGLTPESSKLSLEWRVLKHITIESDVSQDAQGEVGATWKWDY